MARTKSGSGNKRKPMEGYKWSACRQFQISLTEAKKGALVQQCHEEESRSIPTGKDSASSGRRLQSRAVSVRMDCRKTVAQDAKQTIRKDSSFLQRTIPTRRTTQSVM
jgi:hypothetical protein